jgi:hypothetical protein
MHTIRLPHRIRLAPVFEWLVAGAFLLATIGVALLLARELQVPVDAGAVAPVARPAVSAVPASVPAGAVSVPVLPFLDGTEIRVGDRAAAVAARIGPGAARGPVAIDRGTLGDRQTRPYEHQGSRFILVLEAFERHGETRVAAIYLP